MESKAINEILKDLQERESDLENKVIELKAFEAELASIREAIKALNGGSPFLKKKPVESLNGYNKKAVWADKIKLAIKTNGTATKKQIVEYILEHEPNMNLTKALNNVSTIASKLFKDGEIRGIKDESGMNIYSL